MNKRLTWSLIASLLVLATWALAGPASDQGLEKAVRSINPCDPYLFTKTLASPEYEGRLTGTEAYAKAAKWAASMFKEWGLRPISAKDGYLQPYPSPYTIIDKAEMTLLIPQSPAAEKPVFKETPLVPNKDFLPLLYSDSGRNEAGLVFAGWGISAPELGYDDYAGLDVRGKFVLCFRGTPDRADRRFEDHDQHRARMALAKSKGALGVIYIYPDNDMGANPNGDWIAGFTPAVIGERVADMVFKERSTTSADLKKILTAVKRPLSFPLASKVRLAVESRHFPDGVGYNVAGYIEGADPVLKKEVVIFGGHLDHCGRHMGFTYPGADDNASGSATVMTIGRALAGLGSRPKRSMMVVLFGGEELGLQGSTYFADHIPAAFGKVAAMFNFDMTGEGDGAWCGVSAEPADFKTTVEEADKATGILRGVGVMRGVGVRGSDFAPFFVKGIPSASLGSNGPHLAYHQTGDTIYRINPDIMADMARLAVRAGYAWAQR
jgi:hypothetical protein